MSPDLVNRLEKSIPIPPFEQVLLGIPSVVLYLNDGTQSFRFCLGRFFVTTHRSILLTEWDVVFLSHFEVSSFRCIASWGDSGAPALELISSVDVLSYVFTGGSLAQFAWAEHEISWRKNEDYLDHVVYGVDGLFEDSKSLSELDIRGEFERLCVCILDWYNL